MEKAKDFDLVKATKCNCCSNLNCKGKFFIFYEGCFISSSLEGSCQFDKREKPNKRIKPNQWEHKKDIMNYYGHGFCGSIIDYEIIAKNIKKD